MSAYRDSLPDDETRARYDEACQAAGRVWAQVCQELREELRSQPEAAADACRG